MRICAVFRPISCAVSPCRWLSLLRGLFATQHVCTDETAKAEGSQEMCPRPQSVEGGAGREPWLHEVGSRPLSRTGRLMSVRQRGRRERVCNTRPSLRFTSTVKTGSGPFTIPCAATLCAALRERGRFLASSSSLRISSLCDKASPQSTVRCFGAQR